MKSQQLQFLVQNFDGWNSPSCAIDGDSSRYSNSCFPLTTVRISSNRVSIDYFIVEVKSSIEKLLIIIIALTLDFPKVPNINTIDVLNTNKLLGMAQVGAINRSSNNVFYHESVNHEN